MEQTFLSAQTGKYHFVDRDGKLFVDFVVLRKITDGKLFHSLTFSEEFHCTTTWLFEAEDDLDECGLATAVGADDAHIVVVAYFQTYIVEHLFAVVFGIDMVESDDGVHVGGIGVGRLLQSFSDVHHLLGPVIGQWIDVY